MKNNFNFNASIKVKDLDKMEKVLDLLTQEGIKNKDSEICIAFKNLLNQFDDTPKVNGLTKKLRVTDCIIMPATASPIPDNIAMQIRGSLR